MILIPGIGGSIMVQKGSEYRRLFHRSVPDNRWINIYVATNQGLQRWKKDMRCEITYDDDGKIERIIPDTHLSPYDFGGTRGVKDMIPEFLLLPQQYQNVLEDLFHHRYFHFIVDDLHSHGYKDHVSLFGAPYDFRFILDPRIRSRYFDDLQALIETSCRNMGEKAVIVSHSLGGIMFKWFITSRVSQEWIDKHIEKWVCISAPFGGSNNALFAATSGEHYISSMRVLVQNELQHHLGIIACFPNELAYHSDEALLYMDGTKSKPITQNTYEDLANDDIKPFKIWTDLFRENLSRHIKPVRRVPTHVVCGMKKRSTNGCGFAEAWDSVPYHYEHVDGDVVVPLKSLLAVEKVLDRHHITETLVPNTDHTAILSHPALIKIVRDAALKSHKNI